MKTIIVTVSDRKGMFCYDLEVPTDEPGGSLTEAVLETVGEREPQLHLNPGYHCLYLNRQKRALSERETLSEAGVLNGDYLTVISRI